jgi:type IV fimbrial biogenesis protein FimT
MNQPGFTLLELLVVLAIGAVLTALAVPGMQHLRASVATAAAAEHALSAAQLARRTALSTGRSTTLCPTADDRECSFGGARWMLFLNNEGGTDLRREGDEPLVKTWPAAGGVTVSGTRGYFSFQPQPRAASTVTFTFCYPGFANLARSVIVSQTGRPRISRPLPNTSVGPGCR